MNTHNEKAAAFERYCLCSLTISGAVKAGNITDRQWANATEKFASGAVRETAIGFLDTTLAGSGKNGYLFTDEKVYYLATLESPQKLWYDEIEDVFVTGWEKRKDADRTLHFRMKDGTAVEWKSPLLRKTPLCEFCLSLIFLLSNLSFAPRSAAFFGGTGASGRFFYAFITARPHCAGDPARSSRSCNNRCNP